MSESSCQITCSRKNTIVSTNPGDSFKKLGEVLISTDAQIQSAVSEARAAFPAWRDCGVSKRVEHLRRVLAIFQERRDEIEMATTIEMGKTITQSRSSNDWAFRHFEWFLENAKSALQSKIVFEDSKQVHQQVYEPYGVSAVISPWNFPISNFVSGVIQSLLAGNTVVFKVSEEVPLFGKLLDNLITSAELPRGVFNQVYGDGAVGEALAKSQIDLLLFTGSSKIGRRLYRICADKFIPCVLELGGSDAGIVCEDADLNRFIPAIFWSKFINNGQICCGLKRLIVHESLLDETVKRLRDFISAQPIGDPRDETAVFGPLAAERQRILIEEQVADAELKGAMVIRCKEIPQELKGAYYPPTLLVGVTPEMRAWSEELFGPVLTVIPYRYEDEAVRVANITEYGLSGYVYTDSTERFKRIATKIEAGSLSHNGCDYSEPFNSFGGYKGSGLGKTGGELGFHSVSRVKAVSMWLST